MTISAGFRRFAPLALAGTLVLGACGAGNALGKDEVFAVNGSGYSTKDFNSIIDTLVETKQLSKTNGKVAGTDLSSILRVIIKWESYKQFKDQLGLTDDAATVKSVQDSADKDKTFAGYPKAMQDLLIGLSVAEGTLNAGKIPATSRIKSLYEKLPASSGVLCLSHILVKSQAQARQVLKDIAEGKTFAEEANAKTIDPSGKSNGGVLPDGDKRCQTVVNAQNVFDPDFVRGALAAKAGVPYGPVKTKFGWHVILNESYDKVSADIETALANKPLQQMLMGFMATADIRVDSAYGSWDPATSSVG